MKRKLLRCCAGLFLLILFTASAKAGPIGIAFHDSTVVGGTQFDYPIYLDSTVTGMNVISYQIEFTFNNSLFSFVSAQTNGTMSNGWTMDVNTVSPGRIRVAAVGTALIGKGKLIVLQFSANVFPYNNGAYFTFQSILLNEGIPTTVKKDGYVTVQTPPFITVSPNTALLTKGETQQFTVSGGKAPFTWVSTDPAVASMNSSGVLTAVHAGKVKVICTDSAGIVDTSGVVEVRGLKLSLRDTTRFQGQMLDLPVYTTDVTGLGIISGQFSVSYNQNLWTPVEIITSGSLLQSASMDTFSVSTNQINVTFAASTPVAGSGILLYVRMKASKTNSGGSTFSFVNPLFNESISSNTENGYITVQQLSPVTVTPYGDQTMLAGDSLQFIASSGTAPYAWTVSDTSRASISSTGWLKAKKSGIDSALAQDALGAIGKSGKITIYDFRLSIPDTSLLPASTLDIPLMVTPNNVGFASVQMKINYSTGSYVQLVDVITAGTLTEGMIGEPSYSSGSVTIAKAGSNYITSGGTLFKLRFAVPDSTPRPSTIYLTLSNVVFNEGLPSPLTDNGYFTVANNAVFGITPVSGIIQTATVNKKDSTTFTIHNTGTATLTSSIWINGSGEFTLSTSNISVPPADSVKIRAYYLPTDAGDDTASIHFSTNDPYHASVDIPLIGKIVQFPIITVNPNMIDFGTVFISTGKDTTVTITNSGSDTLRVTGIVGTAGEFTARPSAFQIPPGGSMVDTLRFQPSTASTIHAQFLVTSDAASSPDTIKVSGTGQFILGIQADRNVPHEFALMQNYPNPFNPTTMIGYQLPSGGFVSLKVYDALGREVATVVNEIKETGYYSAVFDASGLSSGMYFYTVRVGNFVQTKKMTILK